MTLLNRKNVRQEKKCWPAHNMLRVLSISILFSVGCTTTSKEEVIGCEKTIELGQGEALIDGQEWQSENVTWSESATGIQIIFPPTDGYNITLVAQQDTSGTPLADATYPLQVDLQAEQGGWGILYENTDSHNTQDDGEGRLIIETKEDDILQGCFSFQTAGFSIDEGYFSGQRL